MVRSCDERKTVFQFENEWYVVLPPDTPLPADGVAAHHEVTTLDGGTVYESFDAVEAARTVAVFIDIFDTMLLNIRRDRTWWQWICDHQGSRPSFVVRAAEAKDLAGVVAR